MNSDTISASLLAVTSGVGLYTSFLPDMAEVRKAMPDDELSRDVRIGEVAATSLTVAIGVTASSLSKSVVPAMLSIVAAGGMIFMYESILRSPAPEKAANPVIKIVGEATTNVDNSPPTNAGAN